MFSIKDLSKKISKKLKSRGLVDRDPLKSDCVLIEFWRGFSDKDTSAEQEKSVFKKDKDTDIRKYKCTHYDVVENPKLFFDSTFGPNTLDHSKGAFLRKSVQGEIFFFHDFKATKDYIREGRVNNVEVTCSKLITDIHDPSPAQRKDVKTKIGTLSTRKMEEIDKKILDLSLNRAFTESCENLMDLFKLEDRGYFMAVSSNLGHNEECRS